MATQQDVDNIIDELIIDNTTRQIDPAKMRQVLKAINERIPASSDPSVLTVSPPLLMDEFTNVISIPESEESVDGFLSALFFKKFNRGVMGLQAGFFRLVLKGYTGGELNPNLDVIEHNDICLGFKSTSEVENAGEAGFFQFIGNEGDEDQDVENYMPVITAIVNIT